jgi:type I restriction enzyme S subunit
MMLTSKGTKMPIGEKNALSKYALTLPPLTEQKRVAGILDSLDEKIENNLRLINILETLARALFKKHITNNPKNKDWGTHIAWGQASFVNSKTKY